MITAIPEQKTCPRCAVTLPGDEWGRDSSRPDGLRFYCPVCVREAVDKAKEAGVRLPASPRTKECENCERELPAAYFGADPHRHDHLMVECRTCKSMNKSMPTMEEVVLREKVIHEVAVSALEQIKYTHKLQHVGYADIEKHRSEFEQISTALLNLADTAKIWKLPTWINRTSAPDYGSPARRNRRELEKESPDNRVHRGGGVEPAALQEEGQPLS